MAASDISIKRCQTRRSYCIWFSSLVPTWQRDDAERINLTIAGKNGGPSADCNYLWQSALLLGGVTVSIRMKARVIPSHA